MLVPGQCAGAALEQDDDDDVVDDVVDADDDVNNSNMDDDYDAFDMNSDYITGTSCSGRDCSPAGRTGTAWTAATSA